MGSFSFTPMIDYTETFTFPDIPWQTYPVYSISESGRVYNFKSIIYPDDKKKSRHTRLKQLSGKRSYQAKFFDALIRIGYFDPLPVVREFPVLIRNNHRLEGQDGGYYIADYYFPTALGGSGLIVELDSELHNTEKDKLRDKYMKTAFGIETFRINNLLDPRVQTGRFKEFTKLLRSKEPGKEPRQLPFMTEILDYNNRKTLER